MRTLQEYVAENPHGFRTQREWAEHFGMSRSYFAEILHGRKAPSREAIRKFDKFSGGEISPEVWFREAAE